jgi:Uma2 family endonuclease
MGETGIRSPADRTELIVGEILQMPPAGSPHVGAVFALVRLLSQAVPSDVVVSVQSPIRCGDHSEPKPDLALLRSRPDGYRAAPPPSAADTLLIVEVSDTLRYDRDVKLTLYARRGVPEVWIVDLTARAVEVHRRPDGETYAEVTTLGQGEMLKPLLLPGVGIPVGSVIG